MTEYLEGFGSDPGWAEEAGTYTHDNTNSEITIDNGGATYTIRSADLSGDIEQECQATFITNDANGSGWQGPIACRIDSGFHSSYNLQFEPGAGTGGVLYLERNDYGTLTYITSWNIDIDIDQFWSIRLATEGVAGNNVVCSVWYSNHGASKPSDPGWIGADGSPDQTFTDTGATRLDLAANEYAGCGGYEARNVDNRICFHKQRNISDRAAPGGAPVLLQTNNVGFDLFNGTLA